MAPAHAVLGGAVATLQHDAARMRVQPMRTLSAGVQVQESVSGDGGMIREFVSPSGIVFAVSWRTRLKPKLEGLLGSYHEGYASAATEALKRPGIRRQAVLRAQDLVVHSTAHLNTFTGYAYVPSLTPVGFGAEQMR
ncbi:MAG: DUF2844 domain-containing protein [Burkholderiaceae bacterium]